MKAFLFILAVSVGLAALAYRRQVHRSLDTDDDDSTPVYDTIRNSQTAANNLSDAIQRISNNRNAPGRPPVPALPPAGPGSAQAPPAETSSDQQVSAQIDHLIMQMQATPDQAYSFLETGLAATINSEYAPPRLRLLQAALGIPGNERAFKDISMRELTAYVVERQSDTPITDPTQVQNLEARRTVVSTTYKLYLSTNKDSESVYSDTQRVLSYQPDQSTRELIIFDCLSRFPELRSRFLTN